MAVRRFQRLDPVHLFIIDGVRLLYSISSFFSNVMKIRYINVIITKMHFYYGIHISESNNFVYMLFIYTLFTHSYYVK